MVEPRESTVRTTSPRRSRALGGLALLPILLVAARPLPAQSPPRPPRSPRQTPADARARAWDHYGGLLLALRSRRYVLLKDLRGLRNRPERTLVIVLGDVLPPGWSEWGRRHEHAERSSPLRDFLRAGGRVLIASDRYEAAPTLRRVAGLSLSGETVTLDAGSPFPTDIYRGFPDCPIVTVPREADHPILSGVERIVFNRPAFFRRVPRRLRTLRVPRGFSYPGTTLVSARETLRTNREPGRLVAIADHSVFINAVLPENRAFLDACLDWFEDPAGIRQVAVIVDGELQKPLAGLPPNLPSLDKLRLQDINRLIAMIERSPFWSRKLSDLFHEWGMTAWYAVDPALILGLVVFAGGLIVTLRRRVTPALEALPESDAMPSFLALRGEALRGKAVPATAAIALGEGLRRDLGVRLGLPEPPVASTAPSTAPSSADSAPRQTDQDRDAAILRALGDRDPALVEPGRELLELHRRWRSDWLDAREAELGKSAPGCSLWWNPVLLLLRALFVVPLALRRWWRMRGLAVRRKPLRRFGRLARRLLDALPEPDAAPARPPKPTRP